MKNLISLIFGFLFIQTTTCFATLKLTCPKGGEKFVAGRDTLITWEGISPTDTVKLDFSIDNGVTWLPITNQATGLQYIWKNVPKPTSNECLIKIEQIEKYDSSNLKPVIEWQKTYGGSKFDQANCIIQTKDGGYITTGSTYSDDGDVTNYKGDKDCWVVKLSSFGNIQWEKSLGGSMYDESNSIIQTSDGGYIIAGFACSYDGDVTVTDKPPSGRIWLIKLDDSGTVDWNKTYLNTWQARDIIQTKDGGYIVTGEVFPDLTVFMLKLNSTGNIEWQKSNVPDTNYHIQSVQQTIDGGYITAGKIIRKIGDHFKYNDYARAIIIKFDNLGKIEWQKTVGDDSITIIMSVQQTVDGGYIGFGWTGAFGLNSVKAGDYWVSKIDSKGNTDWLRYYGGSAIEGGLLSIIHGDDTDIAEIYGSIRQTKDSGYVFAGSTSSQDGDVTKNYGKDDVWLVKIDKIGNIIWESTFGDSLWDVAHSMQQTNDGGYIICGSSNSINLSGCTNKGWYDFYIVKLGPSLQTDQSDSTFSIVAPLAAATDIDMKKCVINTQKDSTVVAFVYNAGTYKLQVDSIYFRGTDAKDFSLVWGSPKFVLNPSVGLDVRFRFAPTRIGMHYAEIVIITNSDTLIRKIQGEGVPPRILVLNDVIDFGKVVVGTNKDTLQAVTIKNISTVPITIIKTKHNKPNDYDFSTLAGGGNFVLNPGDTAKLDLRFTPSAIGNTYGTLEFYTEGLSIPSFVILQGEGINKNPVLQAPVTIDYSLICSNTMTNYVPIFNNGGDTLRISEINISGTNYSEFSVNQALPVIIPPISLKYIEVEFKPKSFGTKTANLEIKSNSDPNTIITIPITAKRDSMNLSFVENTIDMGYLCPNEIKDTVINIRNLGNIKTGAYLTNSQNISFGKSEITVLPSNTENITIRFNGLSNEGIINETITLTDSICGFSKIITIIGLIQAPKLESTGLVITCVQLTSNDGILTLENKSDRSVIIKNSPIISAPFSLVGNPFPLSIPANSSKDITLRYSPTEYISHSTTIEIFGEPCQVSYEVTITGIVKTPTAVLKIDTLSAYAGEIINIPIILIDGNYLDISEVTTIQTDLVFNPTLLTPSNRDIYPVQKIDDKQAKIEIKNIPLTQEIGKTLIEIPFVVGLGNAETCDLVLKNSSANGGVTDIVTQSGIFKLLGICREGGTRLIITSGKAEILSIIPNPASDIVEIKVYLIEKGISTIALYNSNGVKLFDEILNDETGLQTINLDLKNYDSGLYFIKLQTPTVVENKKLMIIR